MTLCFFAFRLRREAYIEYVEERKLREMQKRKFIKRKKLKCPCCKKGRVIDSRTEIHTKLYDMEVADELLLEIDFIAKCSLCKRDVGIQKI